MAFDDRPLIASLIRYARVHDHRLFRLTCRASTFPPPPPPAPRPPQRPPQLRTSPGIGHAFRWRRRAQWHTYAPGPSVDRRAGHTETALLWALPTTLASVRSRQRLPSLLIGQLSAVGGGSVASSSARDGAGTGGGGGGVAGAAGSPTLGLSLRLLSPPRRASRCMAALRWLRLPGCAMGEWSLRAATAPQTARELARDGADGSATESGAGVRVPFSRPLLTASFDGAHTAVTFAHSITTVHAMRPPAASTPTRRRSRAQTSARDGALHHWDAAVRDDASRRRSARRRHAPGARDDAPDAQHGATAAPTFDASSRAPKRRPVRSQPTGAVMLELQVEGVSAGSFRLLAHERDGSRLALLLSAREVLWLSRVEPQAEPPLPLPLPTLDAAPAISVPARVLPAGHVAAAAAAATTTTTTTTTTTSTSTADEPVAGRSARRVRRWLRSVVGLPWRLLPRRLLPRRERSAACPLAEGGCCPPECMQLASKGVRYAWLECERRCLTASKYGNAEQSAEAPGAAPAAEAAATPLSGSEKRAPNTAPATSVPAPRARPATSSAPSKETEDAAEDVAEDVAEEAAAAMREWDLDGDGRLSALEFRQVSTDDDL